MLFNSMKFILFFPIVVTTYWLIPRKVRWIWLLFASYFFYMSWNPIYALLMLTSTLITYFCGICINQFHKSSNVSFKRLTLIMCLLINLGLLFAFKYFNFFADSMNLLFVTTGIPFSVPAFDVLLPVGISFYTFQALGYSIDVYQGKVKAEYNLGKYALFVSFFPQLVAGPIERSHNLLTQIHKEHCFNYDQMISGLLLMLWGLFQKVVIADRISIIVNTVYNDCTNFRGISILFATILFALQIYCDFAGYSNVAIGAAECMGFSLMKNFERPYFSKSIAEFWHRWHISLSTWFRDYVYIPLGGNRCTKTRKYINVMVTFIVSGFWHGANFTFIVWGALHGFYQITGDLLSPIKKRLCALCGISESSRVYHILCVSITFVLVDFAWIFFRANSLQDAIYIIIHLFKMDFANGNLLDLGVPLPEMIVLFAAIGIQIGVSIYQKNHVIIDEIKQKNIVIRWGIYFAGIFSIIIFGAYGPLYDASAFIYFQF